MRNDPEDRLGFYAAVALHAMLCSPRPAPNHAAKLAVEHAVELGKAVDEAKERLGPFKRTEPLPAK